VARRPRLLVHGARLALELRAVPGTMVRGAGQGEGVRSAIATARRALVATTPAG